MNNEFSAKVLVISSAHPPRDPRIFEKEILSLCNMGCRVSWFRPGAVHPSTEYGSSIEELSWPNSRLRLVRILFAPFRAWKMARRVRAKVTHLHDPELLPLVLLPGLSFTKIVFDSHEELPAQFLSKSWVPFIIRRPLARLVGLAELSLLRRVHAVIAATPQIADRFRNNGIDAVLVRNFPKESVIEAEGVPRVNPRRFVYIGRISHDRGLEEMIDLTDKHDAVLHLAGRIEPECVELVESAVRKRLCEYHGVLSMASVASLLREGGIGLCLLHPEPNYINSLPTKLFEYMQAGLPVICSDFPLWQSIVHDSGAGIVVNVEELTEDRSIDAFLKTGNLLACAQSGREFIRHKASWSREMDSLRKVYRSLVD